MLLCNVPPPVSCELYTLYSHHYVTFVFPITWILEGAIRKYWDCIDMQIRTLFHALLSLNGQGGTELQLVSWEHFLSQCEIAKVLEENGR